METTIQTVKIQGEGYLVNGTMSVPKADGNRHYKEVLEAIQGGTENYPTAIVVEPEFTDVELLANTKREKKEELEIAFQVASKLPVTVGTKTYNGGKESAQALRDYIQLVTESGGTDYTIWDSSNVIATYTFEEANTIKLSVAVAVANYEFNLRIKKSDVDNATTIEEVNAVVF